MRSAPCQMGLFKGKTPLQTKLVWLFIWVAKELTQLNDLMHLLSFPVFLLQDGVTSVFLLLNFYPKASFLRTNITGHPTLVLLASFLKSRARHKNPTTTIASEFSKRPSLKDSWKIIFSQNFAKQCA